MNNWLDKLERKFSRYAIPNLMTYIIILYAAGFVLNLINPTFYSQFLSLDAGKILQGQIWRIVTFIIQPPSDSLIFIVFVLYLYYMIGKQLEAAWGAFRFNLYFFSGMLFIVIGAILAFLLTGAVLPMDTWYLNLSLFFAFAALYPDIQLLLFFVIPIKIKWLAYLDVALLAYSMITSILSGNWAGCVVILCSLANVLVFFLMTRKGKRGSFQQNRRRKEFKKAVSRGEAEYRNPNGITKHKCAICGRTEKDDPNLEFRFCSRCNGNYEYCQDHLFTHEHVK